MEKSHNLKKAASVGFAMTTLAVLLAGCSGGGGGVVATNIGNVADGYVSGATVKFDIDDSGVCGDVANENALDHVVTTDAAGNFTYPASIAATHIVCASGGTDISTNAPFIGELKAPAGATQVTPATTLVQAVIDAAPAGAKPTPATAATTLANNLGLPAGTNLLTADPVAAAVPGPNYNPQLTQTTTAIQTLLVQMANNVAAAATGATATGPQTAALYSSAIAGLAAALTPVVSVVVDLTNNSPANAAIVNTMVTQAISNTVTAVQADPTAAATVVGVANLAPASVAAVAAANVTSLTQSVAIVPAATLVAPAVAGVPSVSLAAQTSTTGTQTTALLATALTTAVATAAPTSIATLATNAAAVSTAISQGDVTAAVSAAATQVNAVNTEAPTLAVVVPTVAALPTLTNVVPVTGITVNGSTASLTFGTAIGTPAIAANVSASFSVTSTAAGDNRSLSGSVSGLTVTNTAGVLSLTAPASATASISGTHLDGTTATATLTNVGSFVSGSGGVTVDVAGLLSTLSSQTGFAALSVLQSGNFNVTMSLNGVPLADSTGKISLSTITQNVTN